MRTFRFTVGDDAFSFEMNSHCDLPSAHPRPLTMPFLFRFKNIKYRRARFTSSRVKSLGLHGDNTVMLLSCFSSFKITSTQSSPNTFSPLLTPYFGVTYDASSALYCSIAALTYTNPMCSRSNFAIVSPNSAVKNDL